MVEVATAVVATTKPLKKGRREAEEAAEQVPAKKQKQNEAALKQAIAKKKTETKVTKKSKKAESDSSSESEEEVKVKPAVKQPVKKVESSSEEDSSSDEETVVPAKVAKPADALTSSQKFNSMEAPAQSKSVVPQVALFKNRLQEYAQKAAIPLPIYRTTNEGTQHAPMFRSTVEINGASYTSPKVFPRLKSAEMDAARIALPNFPLQIDAENCSLEPEDICICKSILHEYAFKINAEKLNYEVKTSSVKSSVTLNGKEYVGNEGRNKKESEQLAARAAILSLLDSDARTVISKIITNSKKSFTAANGLSEPKSKVLVKMVSAAKNGSVAAKKKDGSSDESDSESEESEDEPKSKVPVKTVSAAKNGSVAAKKKDGSSDESDSESEESEDKPKSKVPVKTVSAAKNSSVAVKKKDESSEI